MIQIRYFALLLVVAFSASQGQAQVKKIVRFSSYNSVGFVAGASPVAFAAQTINGVELNDDWFAGIGFGTDNYFTNTLPLFVDVKKVFEWKKIKLFLYADGGVHFITGISKSSTTYSSSVTKAREYLDAGIGCKFKIVSNQHVFLSLGNTLKTITTKETFTYTDNSDYYLTRNKLSRISFKIGYQF